MEVSKVIIRKVFAENERLSALVSVVFDDMFVVHDIKIINGDLRRFVAMPSKRDKEGAFHDIAHPIKAEAREEIENRILSLYEKELENIEA